MQESGSRLLHPNHYVLTLTRITLNAAYLRLSGRVNAQQQQQQEGEGGGGVPVEVYMRRRDLLDPVHRVVEMAEPGYTRRRGEGR